MLVREFRACPKFRVAIALASAEEIRMRFRLRLLVTSVQNALNTAAHAARDEQNGTHAILRLVKTCRSNHISEFEKLSLIGRTERDLVSINKS